jgi:hypothetical protein
VLAIATILPIVIVILGWIGISESDWSTASWVLITYMMLLLIVHIVLVIRSQAITGKEKRGWIFSLIFFFPFASPAMLYYLYWNTPVRVATNIEEQIVILRELRDKKEQRM